MPNKFENATLLLRCSVNSVLKHKTTGSMNQSLGRMVSVAPCTCELEIEMNCVQYCYSCSSMVLVIRSLPSLAELRDQCVMTLKYSLRHIAEKIMILILGPQNKINLYLKNFGSLRRP